ncbi:phosphoribosyltransferase [Sphaerotilus montanus]|uniref:Putative phosphoribosyl transferase n=1 Tax=Sphaerotilus montanus TaxID=522889 RepID=A0A7Y9U882_9BURK|nr:phosphoribosyltransferase family protein [Sphaerotilus montanus]NYG34587.1 putative phosphoribosyl transferase [Sphaerotilus montanus]NZD56680.1 phosphoribosyltransferase [Sphaerotilus montanus]
MPFFKNRTEAGQRLAERLASERLVAPVVVLALPRGGVPVAAEVARRLAAPLDLLLVRKIGAPWQRELAVAAVVDGDAPEVVIDEGLSAYAGADRAYLEREAAAALAEIERRRQVYLQGRQPLSLTGATVVLVDDGIATGTTVRAALKAVRRRGAARIVLAVPVAPHDILMALRSQCDRIICLAEPQPFRAVGLHYLDFHQVEDGEVQAALTAAAPVSRADAAG